MAKKPTFDELRTAVTGPMRCGVTRLGGIAWPQHLERFIEEARASLPLDEATRREFEASLSQFKMDYCADAAIPERASRTNRLIAHSVFFGHLGTPESVAAYRSAFAKQAAEKKSAPKTAAIRDAFSKLGRHASAKDVKQFIENKKEGLEIPS